MKIKLRAFPRCMLVGAGVLGTNAAVGYALFDKTPSRQMIGEMNLSPMADENDKKDFEKLIEECFKKGLTYHACNSKKE